MSNERFTQLPTVTNALLSDIVPAIQGGVSVQETLSQILILMQANIIKSFAGNPNGNVTGTIYGLCWDMSNLVMYVCTSSGNAATAVWTLSGSVVFPIAVTEGGTGLSTTTINQILYSSAANTIAGLATTNNATLCTSATGIPTWRALGAGQVVIGSAAGAPIAANLSAGPGISITNGNNTITINGTGSGIGWNEVTGTTQAIVADSGYVTNNAGLVTLTLPTTAAFGTVISIIGKGVGGWLIAQNASQIIRIGSSASTAGVGGSVASTNQYDSLDLICTTANTVWSAQGGVQGNLTIV